MSAGWMSKAMLSGFAAAAILMVVASGTASGDGPAMRSATGRILSTDGKQTNQRTGLSVQKVPRTTPTNPGILKGSGTGGRSQSDPTWFYIDKVSPVNRR